MRIHSISLGPTRCHLLVGSDGRAVVVDAGVVGMGSVLLRGCARQHVAPEAIALIVLTHCHFDHFGSARWLRAHTGAKVAAHAAEVGIIESGTKVLPPPITAWGRVFITVLGAMAAVLPLPGCPVDVVVDDAGLDLAAYGIPGRLVHTPGHSPGSLSLLLETGEAFVGDLAMNGPPLRRGPGLPIFGDRPDLLRPSWRQLLDAGAHTIFPAHGPAFPARVMEEALA